MTTEQVITQSTDDIHNKVTEDQRKILSRLVLQRAMASDTVKFLTQENYERLSRQMLSESPEDEVTLTYKFIENRASYYSTIINLQLKWDKSPTEINDLEGNVWSTYTLRQTMSTGAGLSNGGISPEKLGQALECLNAVHALHGDISELVPKPIRVMVLDNDGRIARDAQRRYDAACKVLTDRLTSRDGRINRANLRRGGKSRPIARDNPLLDGVPHGKYEFKINDGTRRVFNWKTYVVYIPENPAWLATIKRIA